jgi:hypothetical protein
MFAAWSLRTELAPGRLTQASRVLARSAQLRRREARGRRWRSIPPTRHTTALLLAVSPMPVREFRGDSAVVVWTLSLSRQRGAGGMGAAQTVPLGVPRYSIFVVRARV